MARPATPSRTATGEQIYEEAKKLRIPGRSKMGKWDLIDAIRKAR